jgi:hypothetical protein
MSKKNELDRKVKGIVQSVAHDIPPGVENAFLEELKGISPHSPHSPRKRSFFYYGGLAAAAAVLLAAVLFIFDLLHLFNPSGDGGRFIAEAGEVWVQAARVEGEPANTVVVNTTDPDITIVWVEKIQKNK